jgi:sugar phosphate isomerase/epimerase
MKLGICNELFVNWPWEKICDFASGVGYQGIEVAPFTLAERAEQITPRQRAALRESAESQGLEIIGLHWLLMTPSGLYITHPDAFDMQYGAEKIAKASVEYLKKVIA